MSHKYTCENDECDGRCELTINTQDLIGQTPKNCPLANIKADWEEVMPREGMG
ncbi:MAG: hypothetical protein WC479_07215 [Candidatus Izemoplasmatales bacterium]